MGNRSDIADRGDVEANSSQRAQRRFAARSGALHFHQDAKAQGLELTPEEIKGLGVEHLAAKLDNLSGSPSDDYPVKDARLAFNAGIYRLTKGLTHPAGVLG